MASDFTERYAVARTVFEEAQAALDLDMVRICHTADERLHITEFTQPAILTAEIAMLRVLQEHFGVEGRWWGGHSLGEYTALVGAGAIPFQVALRLVHLRGKLMQEAVPIGQGGMIAVIQDDLDLQWVDRVAMAHEVDVANYNSPSQVVLSGVASGIEAVRVELNAVVQETSGRVVELNVSAPFHSRLLRDIEPVFREALLAESPHFISERAKWVASNYLGGFHDGTTEGLVEAMTRQIGSPVRWTDNMRALIERCPGTILEIGPNRPLRRFFSQLGYAVISVINLRGAIRAFGEKEQ